MGVADNEKTASAVDHADGTTKPYTSPDNSVRNADAEKSVVDSEAIPENFQRGVKRIEATTKVWSKKTLGMAYLCIWLVYFITSIQEVVVRVLAPFVTSSFQLHSLTASTTVVSSVIGGLMKLPLSKILDTWGRPQGLALMVFIWTLGFVMMSACQNVQTYAAAQVFSVVGSQGVSYCLTVFIADTSSLKNRSFMLAFATSPYIVTTWIGGPFADAIILGPGWRWGFGVFAIVTPIIVAPLIILFWVYERKAKKAGLIVQGEGKKLTFAAVKKYVIDVDLLGILLFATGMALFLLSFSLYSYQKDKFRSPLIICFLVFGALLIGVFVLYEKFLAPVQFIPVGILSDRTVLFGGLMFTFIFFASAVWNSYFSSMLMVVWNQKASTTTYILNIYRVGSCFAALIVAVFIRWSGRFKWVAVYYAIPLNLLAIGLMIQFRQPSSNIGYVIMTQVFVAFAGGPTVIAGEMAMMAPIDHQHIAVIIAILDLFGSVGFACGASVAAAIWTGTFRNALIKYTPAGTPVDRIYQSMYSQLGYDVGSPERYGIGLAYAQCQRYMLIASLSVGFLGLLCAAFWRDIRIKDIKQTRGNVI